MSSNLKIEPQNYQCSPSEVIDLIAAVPEHTPILVDFDETLLLRNSTEEYLNSLQPRFIAVIFLLLLEKLKPWSWLPGIRPEARDWLRVVLATLFFPWTLLLWQKRARQFADTYSNLALIAPLKNKPTSDIIIASLGFYPIVKPILAAMPLKVDRLICCRFWWGFRDRIKGKLFLLQQFLTPDLLQQSLVITDSTDDNPLLAIAAYPCLVKWPQAIFLPALADVYVPLLYQEKAKRNPSDRYFVRVILYDDWLSLILATSWLSSQPLLHALSMLFLVLSFWCIYEVGYIENDRVAEKYEAKPNLTATYKRYINRYDPWSPWIWALLFAIPGLMLLNSVDNLVFREYGSLWAINPGQLGIKAGLWLVVLLAVRLTYRIYNFIDVPSRLWLYPVLQVYKCFGFLLVTATNIVGSISFAAYVLARWIPYLIYRRGGGDRYNFPEQLMRCIFFLFFLSTILIGTKQVSLFLNWQTGIILGYLIFRARHQILEQIQQVKWLNANSRSKV